MSLKIVGAGFGRTGTHSLKIALEHLLDAHCYHMSEVLSNQEHILWWEQASCGKSPHWNLLFERYSATVDWPSACFWSEIVAAFPDAHVLLSIRDGNSWWESANKTIFKSLNDPQFPKNWRNMFRLLLERQGIRDVSDKQACIDVFNQHNRTVIETVDPNRLILWRPGDGWGPICKALDIAVPNVEFPLTNTSKEWEEREEKALAANG